MNAALWLERYLTDVEAKGPGRQEHFDQLVARVVVPDDYRRFFERWRDSVQAFEPCTQTAEALVLGRMVVGLGAESVLETSIALHRTYGVPYIPGSALKGLAAAAAHKRLEDPAWRKIGDDGAIGPSHRSLFGDQESAGYVTFHDALWIPNGDKLPLDLDVMTVHHPDYYQGKNDAPPADWDNPNPVAFVSARGRYLLALTGLEEWVRVAMEILRDALEQDGIGAKTAAGYGRMSVPVKRAPEPINWEPMIQSLNFGDAGDRVPRILQQVAGAERLRAASAIIAKLGRKKLREQKHRDKDWVKQLFEAAGE
jgi:CRISPR-associated protein Cmr6